MMYKIISGQTITEFAETLDKWAAKGYQLSQPVEMRSAGYTWTVLERMEDE